MKNLEFGWFLPTRGDTLDYAIPQQVPPSLGMFERVVKTAEDNGFEYILLPVSADCWDAWLTSALLMRQTKSIRMLVAARPSYINPVLLAKMIATYDQMSEGRISINLIAGQNEVENLAEGVGLDKDARYEVMEEEVEICKALWAPVRPWALPGPSWTQDGGLTANRWVRRARPSHRDSISRSAFQVPSSISPE